MEFIKILAPVLGAALGFALALLYAVRYKIPDLTRRLSELEQKGAKGADLSRAIDSFHTVCRFNQVSCQKEIESKLDKKLSMMHTKLNELAISNADVSAKVELLLSKNGNGNGLKN